MEKIRILVVDDHPLFRQGLRNVLRSESDIDVVGEAANGEEAIAMTQALAPDAVILDINLPDQNGLQVTRQLKALHSSAAVVLLTAYDDSEQILHAFRAGGSAYCPKDVTPASLVQILRQVVQGHFVVGDQIFDQEGLQNWLEHRVEKTGR